MTNLVTDIVRLLAPRKRKQSSSGWDSFNAVCCQHRGESRDTRSRAGLRFDNDGFVYSCFNCNFKAGWRPGQLLSKNTKDLLAWLNATDEQNKQIAFEVIRLREQLPAPKKREAKLRFDTVELPVGAVPLVQALEQHPNADCVAVAEYVLARKLDPGRYWWTPENGLSRRFIIPFTHYERTVGWTARSIDSVKVAKYLSNQHSHYVYGLDQQNPEQQWMFVVEGPLDADTVQGCALLRSEASDLQRQQIAALGPKPVLVPDQDRAGLALAEAALDYGWYVSIPEWHTDIKDVQDARRRYGLPFTVSSIIKSIETNALKTRLKIKTLQKKLPIK